MTSTILHGVPLSQPFRSVAWAFLLHKMPFQVQLTVPGSSSKMGTLHESFQTKTLGRSAKVPLVTTPLLHEDDQNILTIGESPAILTFLCERYFQLTQGSISPFYAEPCSSRKVTIDWYMHWHHSGLRPFMAKLIEPHLRSDLVHDTRPNVYKENLTKAHIALELMNRCWFPSQFSSDHPIFIGGEKTPSIADILAFEEVIQVASTGLLLEVPDKDASSMTDEMMKSQYPNIAQWIQGMKGLPFYDAVHLPIQILGNLSSHTSLPTSNEETMARQKQMQKLLGLATKDGIRALLDAQKQYM